MIELVLLNEHHKAEKFRFAACPFEIGREYPRTLPRVKVDGDPRTSKHHILVDAAERGQLRIVNITELPGRPVKVMSVAGSALTSGRSGEIVLENGEQAVVEPPVRIRFGRTMAEIRRVDSFVEQAHTFHTIDRPSFRARASRLANTIAREQEAPAPERFTEWFEALLVVQRAAAGSAEFFQEAARAVVNIVGLDRGMVILRSDDRWSRRSCHAKDSSDDPGFSTRILEDVVARKQTIYQTFSQGEVDQSLMGVEAVVGSPIVDDQEEVIGVMYGSRDIKIGGFAAGIRPLEAQFVQVIANMVSTGLIRAEREAEASRMRVQFEGFFSKPLAMALEQDPALLDARRRELTMLFLDLRGFSKIAERTPAEQTYQFLSECLNRFTEVVMRREGVVIDYYGDGFAAMWNAPLEQPGHPVLAAEAALEIQAAVPELNEKYREMLGANVRVGIGIHSAEAQVGNSGSKFRLKYGPRGHAVNLASRVEGANKLIGTSCLITESTRQALPPEFDVRRICRARLSGMHEQVGLFELGPSEPSSEWNKLRADYEEALEHFEQRRPSECLQCCAQVLSAGVADEPTRWLLSLANARIGDAAYDPVIRFDVK
jgi:adenylate cyclase